MAEIEPLTEEERMFYATLPDHLGKVRMARVVALVDAYAEALAAAEDPMREQTWAGRFRVLTDRAEKAEARTREMESALKETIERSDSELHSLKLAQVIIETHNANVAKLAALREELRRAKLDPVERVCEDADRLREKALRD